LTTPPCRDDPDGRGLYVAVRTNVNDLGSFLS